MLSPIDNHFVLEPVSRHVEEQGLEFLQFAFRWFNCLLIREVGNYRCIRFLINFVILSKWIKYVISGFFKLQLGTFAGDIGPLPCALIIYAKLMTASVLLDTFPSCHSPVGHISCGRRCIARFPCVHICQFSFNGEMGILSFFCWYELLFILVTVNVIVSFYCLGY